MRVVLLSALAALARASGECFVDPTWTSQEIQIQEGIQYGSSFNNATQKQQKLLLDAYFPPASDARSKRPAAVLVHGGSFTSGDRKSDNEPQFAKMLVERGFVAVSIDYRLTGNYWGLDTRQPALDATEDTRAAVRFVRKMAEEWRIDTDRIMVGGDSAGAITALTLAYGRHARDEGSSGNPGYSSSVALSVPISGEMKTQAFCIGVNPEPWGCQVNGPYDDSTDVGSFDGQPPLLMVHGTADKIVPYVNGKAVYDQAQKVGIKSKLITIQGAGHVPFTQLFKSYFTEFMTFAADAMDLGNAECPKASEASMVV